MKASARKPWRRRAFAEVPTSYAGLCQIHLPRPIHDEEANEAATAMLEIMAGHEHHMTPDQQDYFSVLCDMVEAYENAAHPLKVGSSDPLEMLKYLLDQNGMGTADLSRLLGADRTLGAKILRGERELTIAHIRKLAARFKVAPAIFLPAP